MIGQPGVEEGQEAPQVAACEGGGHLLDPSVASGSLISLSPPSPTPLASDTHPVPTNFPVSGAEDFSHCVVGLASVTLVPMKANKGNHRW